jgi:allantoate deiminase
MTICGRDLIAKCDRIAKFSESSSDTTRAFLCPAMHQVHGFLGDWMRSVGMQVTVDAVGNLSGLHQASPGSRRRLLIGSHLDTVPNAGAFDGVLGVVLGIAIVEALKDIRLPFDIEVIGFSEEEGVRFGVPFLGSLALIGKLDETLLAISDRQGISVAEAIRQFGLDPNRINGAAVHPSAIGYLEFHIEQGPVLEHLNRPLGVVEAIAGQSRYAVEFTGAANHAGTTPMHLRRDALAGAAEWITVVEGRARGIKGLVATVSAAHSEPQAGNVIPGVVRTSLDVRHASDGVRRNAVDEMLRLASQIANRRKLIFKADLRLDHSSVTMDPVLTSLARSACLSAGCEAPVMISGAGHDAMVIAQKIPSAMIFLRTPGGLSHCPEESVLPEDVEVAVAAGLHFVRELSKQ